MTAVATLRCTRLSGRELLLGGLLLLRRAR
jgi:hypothetical protein